LLHISRLGPYAARVALPHAILVSLCERSGSGYELAHRFDRSIGSFWRATHQQIYRTLRAMEDDGWVFATLVVQHGRPDKKVYTVSDTGRAELARWIAEPLTGRGGALSDTRTRDVAVKLRGATYGDPAALRTQISALRAERAQLLDTYRGFEKTQFPDPSALRGSALHQYLVLRGGIRAEESTIDWLDEVTNALQDPKHEKR
jgi:DNA-binding PadR family transcriptional regulator